MTQNNNDNPLNDDLLRNDELPFGEDHAPPADEDILPPPDIPGPMTIDEFAELVTNLSKKFDISIEDAVDIVRAHEKQNNDDLLSYLAFTVFDTLKPLIASLCEYLDLKTGEYYDEDDDECDDEDEESSCPCDNPHCEGARCDMYESCGGCEFEKFEEPPSKYTPTPEEEATMHLFDENLSEDDEIFQKFDNSEDTTY